MNGIPTVTISRAEYGGILARDQIRTINVLRGRSRCDSDDAFQILVERASRIGYSREDVERALAYIRDTAEMVVHFNPVNFQHYNRDTHYRNLFEIGRGGGSTDQSARSAWENACFLDLYKGTVAFEKPKYGALNIMNNPAGVSLATSYGKCHFVLNDDVRRRITLATADTCSSRIIGVLEYCAHVVCDFNDMELTSIIRIANNEIPYCDYRGSKTYKEIQIHGEIRFSRDISKVVMTEEYRDAYGNAAREFCAVNGCELIWI